MKKENPPASPINRLLRIDARRTVEAAGRYLGHLCRRHSADGVLVGLSGGIDSALVTALAACCMGNDAVHAVYLQDRFSSESSAEKARIVADCLGVRFSFRPMASAPYLSNASTAWVMRITHLSGFINRWVFRSYGLIMGETPFVSSLRAGPVETVDARKPTVGILVRRAQCGWDERHLHRFRVLGAEASAEKRLLLSAANRTETMVGWVVKGCAEILPHRPVIGLYKTQIRQLARFLDLPEKVRTQSASPDMMKGITDAFALGMGYGKIDAALDYIDGGLTENDLRECGVAPEELAHVQQMKRLSRWKRSPKMLQVPLDGSIRGDLRA